MPVGQRVRRYPEVNGTTTETALIEASGSVIVVSTCSPVNVIVSRDWLRCRETVANPGPGRAGEPDRGHDTDESSAVMYANAAPRTTTAAAAAETRPTRQVIFPTRRTPSSRARAALEYWVRLTASGSPVILCDTTDALLHIIRIAIAPLAPRRHPPG